MVALSGYSALVRKLQADFPEVYYEAGGVVVDRIVSHLSKACRRSAAVDETENY